MVDPLQPADPSLGLSVQQLRAYALALPGAAESPHFESASFRVPGPSGRIFATIPAGGEHAHLFVDESEVRALAAELPEAFSELCWGRKLAGVRVLLAKAPPDRVQELVEDAWRRRAPKNLRDQRDG
jgi:hypothetical protein